MNNLSTHHLYEHPLAPQPNTPLTGKTQTPPYVIDVDDFNQLVHTNVPARPYERYADDNATRLLSAATTMTQFALDTLGYKGEYVDTELGHLFDITPEFAADLKAELIMQDDGRTIITVEELHRWVTSRMAQRNNPTLANEVKLLILIGAKCRNTTALAQATLQARRQGKYETYRFMLQRTIEVALRDAELLTEEEKFRLMQASVDLYISADELEEQPRTQNAKIRLTSNELEMLKALAAHAGQDLSGYIRGRLLYHGPFDS